MRNAPFVLASFKSQYMNLRVKMLAKVAQTLNVTFIMQKYLHFYISLVWLILPIR